ncbi:hypothetical protein MCUN1_002077 [Malassezia cuniculi]|uniref:Uncharacterized protein n=1 Tax=Malassezia cuniculi TaxID=948313 RepID=A0AAF0EYV1_9BASI|nr:hypothetical protein MCUN1_002077 [Malassezia cuniculi]
MSTPAANVPLISRQSDYFSSPSGLRSRRTLNSASDMQPMSLSLREIASPVSDLSEFSGAPPSPSTLTDIILTLHSSLYGAKRSVPEVREIMQRYYEGSAVFSSPLVSVHGRERIVDQFVLAFTIPTVNVISELRDVICSDFEFDGTRAGIIDHTIRVTFFPWFVGEEEEPPKAGVTSGSITPHPFAETTYGSVNSPAQFARSRTYSSGGWSARPRTPRSVSVMSATPSSARVRGSPHASDKLLSAGVATPQPLDLGQRWAAEGLGRSSIWVLLVRFINPRRMLRSLLTIEMRVMSRFEFNEAGRIVRHEDIWSVREFLETFLPFVSVFYYIQRFILGVLTSWAVRLEFRGQA